MIPYPIIRRLSAWTSASVHRPQPVSVGIGENVPRAWTRLFGMGLPGSLPDAFMTTVGLDEAPARSSPGR